MKDEKGPRLQLIDVTKDRFRRLDVLLKEKVGQEKPVDIVITGGGAARVAQAMPQDFASENNIKVVDNLVIYGLSSWVGQE